MKALQEGAYIKHFQYGPGVVTESDSERTSVVGPVEGTPPKRSRRRKKQAVASAITVAK